MTPLEGPAQCNGGEALFKGAAAFGFRWVGEIPETWLSTGENRHWPVISVRLGAVIAQTDELDGTSGTVHLLGGVRVAADRRAAEVTIDLGDADAASIPHPGLSAAASFFAWWEGAEALHAGAVILDGSAYLLAGEKGAGKSTLLARLAQRGTVVLSDDLAVIRDGHVALGPRCLDLREPTVRALGLGRETTPVREAGRSRLTLGPGPAQAPLAGIVALSTGEVPGLAPLAPAERLLTISRHRAVSLAGPDLESRLRLVETPAWRLTVPQRWDALDEVCELLDAPASWPR